MFPVEDLKKDELAHLIAMHRAAQPGTELTYDRHYRAAMLLTRGQLTVVARELEMPTVSAPRQAH